MVFEINQSCCSTCEKNGIPLNRGMNVFESQEFGRIRIIQEKGKCLFCASDIARALGYKRPADAVTAHCKGSVIRRLPTAGGEQAVKFIPEGDVYRLIIHSKLPTAVKFERWVFDEVLPTIQRYGGYLSESLVKQIEREPEVLFRLAEALVKERKDNSALRKELLNLKPKADFYDTFVDPCDCTNIRATAKELEIPERLFCRYLQYKKYLYRAPAGKLMPYAGPFRRGLFIVRDFYDHKNRFYGCYTLFTPAGKDEMRRLLPEIRAWKE